MTEKREKVLRAGPQVFGRYGFKRTSMEDIAAEAGISRPALYTLFKNKEAIFRACSEHLQAAANRAAEEMLNGEGPFAERLRNALVARHGGVHALLHGMPHGHELMDLNGALAADVTEHAEVEGRRIFATAFMRAAEDGEIGFGRVTLSAAVLADMLLDAVHGTKMQHADPDVFRQRIADLVTLWCAALRR